MNKRSKHTRRLTFIFSFAVFMIMSITLVFMVGFAMFLYRIGVLHLQSPRIPIIFFTVVSVIMGTIFSRFYSGSIYIQLRKGPKSIIVAIEDNGIGMDKEIQKRIFEKFYQGDISHSTAGNGLGLTLTKQIIDLYEGKITLSSKKNKGTTFKIELPIIDESY